MPLVPAAVVIDDAREADTVVSTFDVVTLEHAEAVVLGAERAGRPVVLQVSEATVAFHRSPDAIAAACVAVARASSVDVALHLGHVTDDALARRTADLGLSSVTFTGPTDAVAALGTWAREHGVWLESTTPDATDPDAAAAFVEATGVDSLALPTLDLDRLKALRDAVPVPLALPETSDLPDHALRAAVAAGVVKLGLARAVHAAAAEAVRESSGADPFTHLSVAREALTTLTTHRLEVLVRPQPRS